MSTVVAHADDTPDEAGFRVQARVFLSARLPPRPPRGPVQVMGAGTDDLDRGRCFLREMGAWAVPTWPVPAGGRGLSPNLAAVWAEELSHYDAPDLYPWMVGISLVGPTLLAHGGRDQSARWLPPIRSGEEIWCQLFSEPGAGSDLAALACRAERAGDTWRVKGQKVWSSRAHYSRWGLLLARTDPTVPKHAGITAFAVDIRSPGVEVRPTVQMNGDTHFNEVFLDDVAVPEGDRIGEVGRGWGVAMTVLALERASIGEDGSALTVPQVLDRLRRTGKADDPLMRQRAADVVARLKIAGFSKGRSRAEAGSGQTSGPGGPGAKVWMSDTVKAATELAMDLGGPGSTVGGHEWQTLFLTAPSLSIRGGTDEVMRNIVGERVLGLPPEPRVDKDAPFNAVPRGQRPRDH